MLAWSLKRAKAPSSFPSSLILLLLLEANFVQYAFSFSLALESLSRRRRRSRAGRGSGQSESTNLVCLYDIHANLHRVHSHCTAVTHAGGPGSTRDKTRAISLTIIMISALPSPHGVRSCNCQKKQVSFEARGTLVYREIRSALWSWQSGLIAM